MRHSYRKAVALVAIAVFLVGCAAGRAFRRGESAARTGDWDTAVQHYRRAVQQTPDRAEFKIALERAMISASLQHLDRARILEARGGLEEALREYRLASEFDPPNRQLASKVLEVERRIRDQVEAANPRANVQQMREAARQGGPPPLFNLNTVLEPIRFNQAGLRDILNSIGAGVGINVTYESTFQDRTYSIQLEGVTFQEALSQILAANQLFFKVVNPRTVMVIPDNAQKRAQYEEQVVRTFYISHADVADIERTLNQVVRIPGPLQAAISANKTTSTVTIRATPAVADIAEKVISQVDKPRAEVMIDVQILEVSRTRTKEFGLDLGSYALDAVFSPEANARGDSQDGGASLTSRPFNLNTITRGISTADFYLAVPAAVVRFLETDLETKVIAKPQLRGAEGVPLKLNLGEDIPVPSTTFTPVAQGGANFQPLTSFEYRSVGVNVEMTPRVTYEGDIRLELFVESSTLGPGVVIAGQELPSFGSRKVTTVLRLREGESSLLAGLLREDQRKQLRGFPGILRLPVIKQLFSSNESSVQQTDIVMLLTPRIVRTHELTPQDFAPVYIGTQTNLGLGGPPPLIAPQGSEPAAAAPVVAPVAPTAPGAVLTPTPASGGLISVSPPSAEFRVGGGPYTVPIAVSGASQLSNITVTMTYNPAVLRVRTIQEGSFMRSGGVQSTMTPQTDANAGRIDLAIVRPQDNTGVAGTGLLAALLFEAVGAGPASLTITGSASTPRGTPVALEFAPIPAVMVR